jgi:two-component sensor histidine kinase
MRASSFNQAGMAAAIRVLQLSKRLRQHPLLGYATAIVSVGLACLLQWAFESAYGGAPFLTIYPAVILTALVGGLGAGALSAILAGVSQWAFFIPTLHWFAVVTYVFDATVAVLLIVFINRTLDLLVAGIDLEKQAKQHQYLLATELHHRIQNLFTVIQAVIRFSLPGDGAIAKSVIKERLIDRLQAMSATNQAITDSMGGGVRLIDLVNSSFRGFESRIEIAGKPGLVLGPQMAQNFSLILHELLTNALKYGALSVPDGRVRLQLDWTSFVLTFVWQERGGPAVTAPANSGFGSRILGDFAKSFCRNVEARYAPEGFRYMLQIHSDQNRFVEPGLASTTESDSIVAATEKLKDDAVSGALRGAESKPAKDAMLHDWELYQARNEGSERALQFPGKGPHQPGK